MGRIDVLLVPVDGAFTMDMDGMVEVVISGATEVIDATLVEPVAPGDLVLVHAGVALSLLDLPAMTVAPGGAATTAT